MAQPHAHETEYPVSWEQLPQLDLYMDQVLTLLNMQVEALSAGVDRPLTSSMINNYVKDGVIPRPAQKKYNREHLTMLGLICMLKAQFSLPEIHRLLEGLSAHHTTEEIHAAFCQAQVAAMQDTAAVPEEAKTLDEAGRYRLAMTLALEANAKRLAAANLIASLSPEEDAKSKKK